jgi:hypothetical protein
LYHWSMLPLTMGFEQATNLNANELVPMLLLTIGLSRVTNLKTIPIVMMVPLTVLPLSTRRSVSGQSKRPVRPLVQPLLTPIS